MIEVQSEMVANVGAIEVVAGDQVPGGSMLMLLESMKMEIPVLAPEDGVVVEVRVAVGDVVQEGDVLVTLQPSRSGKRR